MAETVDVNEVDVVAVLGDILDELESNFAAIRESLDEIKEIQLETNEKLDNLSLPGSDFEITDRP